MKKSFYCSALIFALAWCSVACEKSASPSKTESVKIATATNTAEKGISEKDPQDILCTYEILKIKDGNGFTHAQEYDFGKKFVSEERYMKMFGVAHLRMVQQMITVNGMEGSITFTEFSNSTKKSAYENAQKYALSNSRKTAAIAFGNFVLLIQVKDDSKMEEFVKLVKEQLLKNIQ